MVTFGKQWCGWCQDHTQWDDDICLSCKEAIAEEIALRAINAELLEALKGLFAVLEPEIPGSPDSPLERARAAIAKAEGE